MLKVHQLGRHLQVYQDKELTQRAAAHPRTTFEPSKGRRKVSHIAPLMLKNYNILSGHQYLLVNDVFYLKRFHYISYKLGMGIGISYLLMQ